MNSTEQTCAEAIIRTLLANGVDTVFGIPGVQTYSLFDALHKHQGRISTYVSRHEQGAAYMALGYAKSTGRTGVYCVVPGPGVLNTASALCTGHNAPLLCLAGQVPSAFLGLGHGVLHELPGQLDSLRLLTKWAQRINHPAEAPLMVNEALRNLGNGRAQPIALEIPCDVLEMPSTAQVEGQVPPRMAHEPDPNAVQAAAKVIRKASRPMLYVGSGAIHAQEEIAELARLIQAPVTSFRGGRGIVGDDTPYGFNCVAGQMYYCESDLMIGIGSRLELPAFRWQEGIATIPLIRIDIDPTQSVRLRGDVGIVADSKLALRALLRELTKDYARPKRREAEFETVQQRAWNEIQKIQPQMAYLDVLRNVLPRAAFIVEEISQVGFASWCGFPVCEPRKFVTGGFQGNLGHGFQTAIGVKIANPDVPVVSITGDGGFMYGVQELATAVQYGIGLIVLIFNNNSFGNVRPDRALPGTGFRLGTGQSRFPQAGR